MVTPGSFRLGSKMALQNCAGRFIVDMKSDIVLSLAGVAHLRHDFLNISIWVHNQTLDSSYRRVSQDEQSWMK
jgi:hypothetical protein